MNQEGILALCQVVLLAIKLIREKVIYNRISLEKLVVNRMGGYFFYRKYLKSILHYDKSKTMSNPFTHGFTFTT